MLSANKHASEVDNLVNIPFLNAVKTLVSLVLLFLVAFYVRMQYPTSADLQECPLLRNIVFVQCARRRREFM